MIVPMQKVAVVAHRPQREKVLDALQEAGLLHVNETTDAPQIDHSEANFRIAELQFCIDTLKDIAPKDVLAKAQRGATDDEILAARSHTDVRAIIDALHALEESDTHAAGVVQESTARIAQLQPWIRLPYHLDTPRSTAFTQMLFGTVTTEQVDPLRRSLQEHLPKTAIELIHTDTTASLVAHVWHDDAMAFEEIATRHGWTTVDLPALNGTPADLVSDASKAMTEAQKTILKNADQRMQWSRHLPQLMQVAISMQWLSDKQAVREQLSETSSIVTLLGWMPKKEVHTLERALHRISPAIAIFPVKADPDEQAPIALKHLPAVAPFRSVTTLYGLPRSDEMDPTASLAPFFTLFFALCLTDAGYGAVLAFVFGGYLLWKRLSPSNAPLVWTLFIGGIATFFAGILFGGWFGLSPDRVPEWLTVAHADGGRRFIGQVWNLAERDGIMFLLYLSLVLGITHIFYGMFLSGVHKWLHGQKAQAFWQDFLNHLLLFAVIARVVAPPAYAQSALWVLLGVLALFIWGKGYGSPWYVRPVMGALGLVNFAINILSNGLSYLRILALGLVTGSLAGAVNEVAVALGTLFPLWIGIPVIVLIFSMGHLVSIALNTLGTFIHAGRLQFIEFFGQFFEGGGSPFTPFSRKPSS